MTYSYFLHEHAQLDYEQSLIWYLERSYDAGDNFIKAIDAAIQMICKNPYRWRNKYKNFHEYTVKKFPFSIIYTIEEDKSFIIISSIYHHKRDPKGKYRKV